MPIEPEQSHASLVVHRSCIDSSGWKGILGDARSASLLGDPYRSLAPIVYGHVGEACLVDVEGGITGLRAGGMYFP